jgi:alpha-mannosidase
MRIAAVESTDLFLGTPQRPLQVVRVVLERREGRPVTVGVHGPGVRNDRPFGVTGPSHGERETVEVGVRFAAPARAGSTRRVTVTAEGEQGRVQAEADVTVAEPGWTMWMVSHFHYDPVWWNTQGQFTEARLTLPDEHGALPDFRNAFELVGAHLDKARRDADYKFVLAETDYLKPYLDAVPADRDDLRALIAAGRVEIVGGNYNEPNTNLTCAESTIRNAVYGMGFQRDVAGGDPRTAWMLDVFGHDPGYPGLMAAAGLTSSAWARGPFHQWGPAGAEGGVRRMQFRSEFEWMSPDGRGLLTHYMAHHYSAGWALNAPPDLAAAEAEAHRQFRGLAAVAATPNVLLPVGADHVIPARWVTDIHRDWNSRYVWPRFVCAVPSEFFAAVREAAARDGTWITPQTRDMNPVYTGKDVSYIDTKQAQRAIETAVVEAERLATAAWLAGAPYPHEALDRVWRLLAYGAHHDAITGVESDQVYLDLLGGWREAWELASAARGDAAGYLAGPGDIAVCNGLARPRDGMARVTVPVPEGGPAGLELRDEAGAVVPALAEGVRSRADGSPAEVTLTFRARDVPALGARGYRLQAARAGRPACQPPAAGWADIGGVTIENDRYRVSADPARGGTVLVTDKRLGAAVLREPGNELVLQEEYPQHPRHGEGPWNLSPRGPGTGSSAVAARVRAQRCPAGSRLVAAFALGGLEVTQETLLWDGADRVEFRTHVDGSIGHDRLLRVRFPADVPGGLPVYQTATAVIGRPFGVVDADSADCWYTLDSPAYQWFGLGSAARVRSGPVQAIGVAEVVCPETADGPRDAIRDLMAALAAAGVTATCGHADGPRYGAIDADSNLPDVRIAVGGPEVNGFTAAVLSGAPPGYAKALASRLAGSADGTARLWVPGARDRADAFGPGADVRGACDLPVLVVAGSGPGGLSTAVTALARDLADALIDGGDPVPGDGPGGRDGAVALADRTVALLNRGTPGGVVTPDGTLHMSLMRSCSAWPSGIWIDGERRAAPDGSSFAWQHWSHTFEYALASGPGDWRAAGLVAAAEDYNHDLIAAAPGLGAPAGAAAGTPGPAGAAAGPGGPLLSVEPANVTVGAVKPRGNPLASGRPPAAGAGAAEVTVRLRETAGRACTARLRFRGGSSARLTGLLEEADGAALPAAGDGAFAVDMPAFGTVTLAVAAPRAAGPAPAPHPPAAGGPVYARYWLHGTGPAPAGNLPVAVHLSPTRVALPDPAGRAGLRLTVACGPRAAAGTVRLDVPAGIDVTPGGPLEYRLAPGGHAAWDLAVRAAPGTPAGRYFVAARIRDERGLLVEDVAMVAVGERRWPDPALPPEEALEAMLADSAAGTAEAELAVLTPELRLPPGGRGELQVRVTCRLGSQLRGEARLISPFGTWQLLRPPALGFAAGPGESAVLRFAVTAPADARPGAAWWALVKVAYFGRVRYTEAIPVTVCLAGHAQPLGEPVGRLRAPAVADVHAHVVALLEQPQLGVRRLLGHPGRVLPGDQPVLLAEDHDHGLGQPGEHAPQAEPGGERVGLLPAGRPAVVRERGQAVRGAVPDQLAVVVGAAADHDRADPRLEGRRARRVVAAEAHPEDADPAAVEVAAGAQHVEGGGHRRLEVRPDLQGVPRLALAGAVEGEGGHPAGQQDVLRREELLLGRVQARDEQDEGRAPGPGGPPQVADHGGAREAQFHPFRRRVEQPVGLRHGRHRPVGGRPVPGHVQHPDELGEVIAQRRACPRLARGQAPAPRLRLAGEAGVQVPVGAPRVQPVRPAVQRPGDPGEVTGVDALRGEAGTPVGHGRGDFRVRHGMRLPPSRPRPGTRARLRAGQARRGAATVCTP